MLMTTTRPLFDIAAENMNSAILNICDCFGNVSSQMNIQFRVRYPGAYAADRITIKGDPHKLGTVSYTVDSGLIVINAYVCYDFTDQRSIMENELFDPINLFACLYQITTILGDFSCSNLYLSINSFSKFSIPAPDLINILQYVSNRIPYNLILTV